MLRFDAKTDRRATRNYLARPQQVRLLSLFGLLGLVFLAITQLQSPAGKQAMAALLSEVPAAAPPTPADLAETRLWMTAKQRESILDNARFRNAETGAWLAVLAALQESPPSETDPAVPVTYAQLVAQPNAYRGRTVRVEGEIMRVETITPADNQTGLERYHRIIFRPSGDEAWPFALHAIKLPNGLDDPDALPVAGSAVGVFFKNQSYQSGAERASCRLFFVTPCKSTSRRRRGLRLSNR